jgi:hypothetical protein
MLHDTAVPASTEALARTRRTRIARLVQVVSVVTFVAAASAMLIAGALHSAGRTGTSSMLATLGYALGVAGIITGVLALSLDSDQETS